MKNIRLLLKIIVKFIPGALNLYRYFRNKAILSKPVLFRENLGFFFNGLTIMELGEFEKQENLIFDKLINAVDLFINVGANSGYYVCKALNKQIPVVAFEPNQFNVNCLLRNVTANNFKEECQIFPLALSEKVGVMSMFGAFTGASLIEGWAGQTESYLVPVSRFDNFGAHYATEKNCFVLVDIEGAELGFLKGAMSLLQSSKNNIFLIEIGVSEHQPTGVKVNPNLVDTFALMFSQGYKAYTATENAREIEMKEVLAVYQNGVNTFETQNFVFMKDKKILEITI